MELLTARAIRSNATDLAPLESQKEYRERISTFIRMHTARVAALDNGLSPSALPGNNMLIIAQTGCGKSYTATRLAEAAGVNLVTIDCSSLTLTGYKGCNLGETLFNAYTKADSKHDFERSIILFDEVDKMRIDGTEGNPQANFLKLFDGTIQADNKSSGPSTLDVSRMSFLFAGAFAGLEEIIKRRLAPRSIGFSTCERREADETNLLSLATMADIRTYGFMDELLGRIGTLLYVPPLTAADYRTLLKGHKGSVLDRYGNLFSTSGVSLSISDSACALIARDASKSALGARSVEPLVYNSLQSAFTKIDEDSTINRVTLSCRDDHLTLQYGHGKRADPTCQISDDDPRETDLPLPDVNIGHYLETEEGIKELLDLSLQAFNHPGTRDEHLLKIYLNVCYRFMQTLNLKRDKVLSSVTKLANTTKMDGENDTCFDRIVSGVLNRKFDSAEQKNSLAAAYLDYCPKRSDQNHEFWVRATKEMCRNWYKHLLRKTA